MSVILLVLFETSELCTQIWQMGCKRMGALVGQRVVSFASLHIETHYSHLAKVINKQVVSAPHERDLDWFYVRAHNEIITQATG